MPEQERADHNDEGDSIDANGRAAIEHLEQLQECPWIILRTVIQSDTDSEYRYNCQDYQYRSPHMFHFPLIL